MNHVARANPVQQFLGITRMCGIFHGVQVVQVAEEFVEAMYGRQELVEVSQVILAELSGRVAHRLERGGDRRCFRGKADCRTSLADGGHAGADRQFAGDEVRATGGAARFGVVIGEDHALRGKFIEMRRPAGHHAAVVSTDVPNADVISHDDDDVGLLARSTDGGLSLTIANRQCTCVCQLIGTAGWGGRGLNERSEVARRNRRSGLASFGRDTDIRRGS